jgi:hypothetical protein
MDLHYDVLAKGLMIDHVANAIFRRHVIIVLLPLCLCKTGLLDDRRYRLLTGVLFRSPFPNFLSNKWAPEFVRTAEAFASHFGDHLSIHRHDGMIDIELALQAIGINVLTCRILFQHNTFS